jgi:hypothetical protein
MRDGNTAAITRPMGPRNAHIKNQKHPPRPFDVPIHAPMMPQTNQSGIPSHCLCMSLF